jgi:hypothetical protein
VRAPLPVGKIPDEIVRVPKTGMIYAMHRLIGSDPRQLRGALTYRTPSTKST